MSQFSPGSIASGSATEDRALDRQRAVTPEQKRAVIERILAGWLRAPSLRLGQFLMTATSGAPLYYTEDEALAQAAEQAFVSNG